MKVICLHCDKQMTPDGEDYWYFHFVCKCGFRAVVAREREEE